MGKINVTKNTVVKYLVACSAGNDSVALIQYMLDNHEPEEFAVVYNDTGWARGDWPGRVKQLSSKCFGLGVQFFITKSEGMEALVRRKKGWPMPASNMQFCTRELKEKPTFELLEKIDPNSELVIVTGRRREESRNRANLAKLEPDTEKYNGRDVYNPLVNHTEQMRDELIIKFGFDVLPHSSMECYPCVCANKSDLAAIPTNSSVIDKIEKIEIDMGFTRNKKPRTMFRPYRVGGGVGIRQAVEWGHGERGWKAENVPVQYVFSGESSEQHFDWIYDNLEHKRQCDGGLCGS